MQRIEGKPVFLIIPEESRPLVDRLIERHGIKETQAVRALFLLGMELYLDMEKVGIPQTAAFVSSLKDRLHKDRRFYEEKVVADLVP